MPLPGSGTLPGPALLPGAASAVSLESLALDGLNLNSTSGVWALEQFDAPPPAKRPEWTQSADADGSSLVRDPLFENRTVTLRLRANQQTTMDAALDAILALSKKLEECEQHADGLPLVWSPAGSLRSDTFYVLSGAIQDVPVTVTGDDAGWFLNQPVVSVVLTCKPFMYGAPVTVGPVSGSGQLLTLTLPSVPGDVAAEGRLIVTDGATQSRRYLEWGLEQRYYNAATSLQITPTITGFAGTSATRSGSVNTNVAHGVLYGANPAAIAGTGIQAHIGTFRVKARAYVANGDIQVRLSWQDGDGSLHSNSYVNPATTWVELDLGLVTINAAQLGTQKWQGQIEAYSPTNGASLDIDYLLLIPASEGYGRARTGTASTYSAGSTTGYDDFDNMTGGAVLNGRTARLGGTWTSTGATTDFVGATSGSSKVVSRATTSDASARFATLGTTATNVDVQVTASVPFLGIAAVGAAGGIVARWVDANNYLLFDLHNNSSGSRMTAEITQVIAGVATSVALNNVPNALALLLDSTYVLRMVVYASGTVSAQVTNLSGQVAVSLTGQTAALATGGTLASGLSGIYDINTTANAGTRTYDSFIAQTPRAEQIVVYPGRAAEVRYDGVQRQDSTGIYYGPVPTYRGSRLLIPPAGDKNRSSRIAVKAHRNNIETGDAANVTDALTASVVYTPRFLVVPGA